MKAFHQDISLAMDIEKARSYGPISLHEAPLPRFQPASKRTQCPNSLDCDNNHQYLITTDHLLGARFPDDEDYGIKATAYLNNQISRKILWLWLTAIATCALYGIHYGSQAESPCRSFLHDGTESPTVADKYPFLILQLQWKDFSLCIAVIVSILLSVSLLWKADAVLERAVEMRQRRKIHGLPIWPPDVPLEWRLWTESWWVNLFCFLVTLGITGTWSWSVILKAERERKCRMLL